MKNEIEEERAEGWEKTAERREGGEGAAGIEYQRVNMVGGFDQRNESNKSQRLCSLSCSPPVPSLITQNGFFFKTHIYCVALSPPFVSCLPHTLTPLFFLPPYTPLLHPPQNLTTLHPLCSFHAIAFFTHPFSCLFS